MYATYHANARSASRLYFPCYQDRTPNPGTVRDCLGLSGTVRDCLGLSGTVWDCLGLSGTVWDCLGLSGTVWDCLGLSGTVWDCLGLSGTVWDCLGLSGTVWDCLGLSGTVWDCLGLSGTVWDLGRLANMCTSFAVCRPIVLQLWTSANLHPVRTVELARARTVLVSPVGVPRISMVNAVKKVVPLTPRNAYCYSRRAV